MNPDGLVSVVVPTRNSVRTLPQCLQSIREQTYPRVELIVVDNYSVDGTQPIARTFADMVVSRGPERSAQRNYGGTIAHGDYLLFIDSDMILNPSVVACCVEAARGAKIPAVIVPERSFGDNFLARCRALERSCYEGDDTVEAARFFSRQAFEAVGGFDEQLDAFEDWDLTRRLSGGARLPRATDYILHDEGEPTIRSVFQKKRKYAASFGVYYAKYGASALSTTNVLVRPAFFRHWRRLAQHPLLAVGMMGIKSVELVAGAVGVVGGARVAGFAGRRRAERSGERSSR